MEMLRKTNFANCLFLHTFSMSAVNHVNFSRTAPAPREVTQKAPSRAKMRGVNRRNPALLAGVLTLFVCRSTSAQNTLAHNNIDRSNLPDAPVPKQDQTNTGKKQQKSGWQSSIGLITRKSFFYPDLATTPGPLTSGEKFELFLTTSMSPPQILASAAAAGISEARGTFSGYGQGGEGFGKRFGASMASNASSHFFGTFLLPSMLHEDPRYFVSGSPSWKVRVGHALRRTMVIRTDYGGEKFNLPGTMGPLAAEGMANLYLPDSERTVGKTFERFGFRIGFGAVNNLLREYWPTIFKSLGISKVAPGLGPQPTATPSAPSGEPPKTL